jgi:membrane peptidoglycan carboxypeptidase
VVSVKRCTAPGFSRAIKSNYTPIDQISPYLRKCVLTTEDPSFFSHHGFINEAFRQSIVKNIKLKILTRRQYHQHAIDKKRFPYPRENSISKIRGNFVSLHENNRIVSKERMLEVYFNIIEWGPNVYGIGEASRFYFQKSPSELTFNECFWLESSKPKKIHVSI